MKTFRAITFSAALLSPMFAIANPGCGLGSQVFEGQNGVLPHVLAATTNGIFGNQTFGMSSGTLGCDTSETVKAAAIFINNNMDQVAENIARGEGEALTTLAEMLNIESVNDFAMVMQDNFANIYTSEKVTAQEVISNIHAVLLAS